MATKSAAWVKSNQDNNWPFNSLSNKKTKLSGFGLKTPYNVCVWGFCLVGRQTAKTSRITNESKGRARLLVYLYDVQSLSTSNLSVRFGGAFDLIDSGSKIH